MPEISDLGAMLRFPFDILADTIHFIMRYLLPILIVGGSLWFIYYMFNSGIIKRLTDELIKWREKKKDGKLD